MGLDKIKMNMIFVLIISKASLQCASICSQRILCKEGGGTMQPSLVPVNHLRAGEKGRIAHIRSGGELARRIRDMGMVAGMPVTMLGRAPLGDPVALRVAGTTVALRRHEAEAIFVAEEDFSAHDGACAKNSGSEG